LLPVSLFAQQDALYSQYMFNQFTINPAYAGSREALSGVLLHRAQWVGIDGAPSTTTLSLHSKLKGKKVALGFNMYNDQLGPLNNNAAYFTYAYHLKLAKGQLSMALRGGMFGSALNRSLLKFNQLGDTYDTGGSDQAFSPTFDAGLYYYTNTFYLGQLLISAKPVWFMLTTPTLSWRCAETSWLHPEWPYL
jgi:type IX secretion system PorP/SprF family membrane protein